MSDTHNISIITNNTLAEALGIELLQVDKDIVKARMPVDKRTKQPMGLLHGGATAALIETLASIGSYKNIANEKGSAAVGVELNVSHLSSASEGWVIGIAKPIRLGKSIHVWNVEVFKEEADTGQNSKLISSGRCTLFIRS